jgi:RNA polymerase sigma factor (TIGR02999 family)
MLDSRARLSSRRGTRGVHVARQTPPPGAVAYEPAVMVADELSATELLLRAGSGDTGAVERMFPLVYDELKRLARRHLARESDNRTLGTTELVHEAYLKLIDQTRVEWGGRAHFMGVAAIAMRRILVDRARSRRRLKRGGGSAVIPIDIVDLSADDRADLVLALDDALDRLRTLDARQARVVECRYFGGMTEDETAEAIGVGVRTVKRDWAKARSWLYAELYDDR